MENKEIILGRNPVLEYIRNIKGRDAILYVSESAHGKIIDRIKEAASASGIQCLLCSREKLSDFASSSQHQGVVLILNKNITADTQPSGFFEAIAANRGILLLPDQITDPHNLGSIIRSAEALGASGIVLPSDNSCGVNSTVVKSSAGASAHIRIDTVPNVASFIDKAKKTGFWIIGTADTGDIHPSVIREYRPAVIIIGSEGSGMRRLTAEKCDIIVRIPLKGKVSSLNASVAAGIVLYEALKD